MKRRQHLHLIHPTYPGLGIGSDIVLMRHLSRLTSEGWKITVSAPFTDRSRIRELPSEWNAIEIPARQWWWPPVRDGSKTLASIRSALTASYLAKRTRHEPADYVLAPSYKSFSSIGLKLARLSGAKFHLLVYDREETWAESTQAVLAAHRETTQISREADKVLAVTDELLRHYSVPKEKGIVLRPIPGEKIYSPEWNCKRQSEFKIVHAGNIKPEQEDTLSKLASYIREVGGKLILIAPTWNKSVDRLKSLHANVESLELFRDNEDAVRYVSENALAFLAVYEFDPTKDTYSGTSFPSKVLEFMRSGVPIMIVAPSSAAVMKWAASLDWPTSCDRLDRDCILDLLGKVSRQSEWLRTRTKILSLASGSQSASQIHSTFVQSFASSVE